MRTDLSPTLRSILTDTLLEMEQDKTRQNLDELKRRISDAPPLLSFANALRGGHALIAELKECSPSQGSMRSQNVQDAPAEYKKASCVKAVSVLTSWTNFGSNMRIERLQTLKQQIGKPVLRKDFIIDEYQVYQARAYGADAILLMANVVTPDEMRRLSDTAFGLGLDVLFETHEPEELNALPPTAAIIGINSRDFKGNFAAARLMKQSLGVKHDSSVDLRRFEYVHQLPGHVLKVAESGISADNCKSVFALGFHAILVGTSLLTDERGLAPALADFETALQQNTSGAPHPPADLRPA